MTGVRTFSGNPTKNGWYIIITKTVTHQNTEGYADVTKPATCPPCNWLNRVHGRETRLLWLWFDRSWHKFWCWSEVFVLAEIWRMLLSIVIIRVVVKRREDGDQKNSENKTRRYLFLVCMQFHTLFQGARNYWDKKIRVIAILSPINIKEISCFNAVQF